MLFRNLKQVCAFHAILRNEFSCRMCSLASLSGMRALVPPSQHMRAYARYYASNRLQRKRLSRASCAILSASTSMNTFYQRTHSLAHHAPFFLHLHLFFYPSIHPSISLSLSLSLSLSRSASRDECRDEDKVPEVATGKGLSSSGGAQHPHQQPRPERALATNAHHHSPVFVPANGCYKCKGSSYETPFSTHMLPVAWSTDTRGKSMGGVR